MKGFILKLLAFLIIISAIFLITSILTEKYLTSDIDYLASMIDKHHRIDSINSPKIILSGGSNTAFGFDSDEIEREFSVPVVNLALHAGLGLDFILNELKYTIKSGDIVFLSIEYYLDIEGDYSLKKNVSTYYPESSKYYSKNITKEINLRLESTRNKLKKVLKSESKLENFEDDPKLYFRNAFNNYGDYIAHLNLPSRNDIVGNGNVSYTYWKGTDLLNEFNRFARDKNVKVYYLFSCYPIHEFEKNKSVLTKHIQDLQKNLEIEILASPFDFTYSIDNFYNTVYHLNKTGRQKRTQKLIEIIKNNPDVKRRIIEISTHQTHHD